MLGLTWYLDDSGSDESHPIVTCGGLALSRIDFKHFSIRWAKIYKRNQFLGYTLEPPLHMTDFVATGKYAGLRPELKRALFRDVVSVINDHKLYSAAVAISQIDFASELNGDIRKALIGPYAFAFFSLVLAHQYLSERHHDGPFKAAYLVDRGFRNHDQLIDAHKLIVEFERAFGSVQHTGALATDSDDRIPALQAADAIAWASRKIELQGSLPEGFEPLGEALREDSRRPHVTIPIDRDGIRMLTEPIKHWTSRTGRVPKLTDVVVRHFNGFPVRLRSPDLRSKV